MPSEEYWRWTASEAVAALKKGGSQTGRIDRGRKVSDRDNRPDRECVTYTLFRTRD